MIWEIDDGARSVEGLDASGRPDPGYAAALGLLPAPYTRRAAATSIEVLVYLLLQLPVLLVAMPALVSVMGEQSPAAAMTQRDDAVLVLVCALASSVLTTAFVLVQLILHGRKGVTLGKGLMGIRSVNVRTLERPGFWRGAVVRYLVLYGSFLVPLLGPLLVIALSPLWDTRRRGRGWPDLAGATWFVDIRRGLNPYDVKRMRIARKTVATDLRDERPELPSLATSEMQRGPAPFIPATRSRGGVLGAHGVEAPAAPSVPPPAPAPSASATWAPPVLLDAPPAPAAAAPAPEAVPAVPAVAPAAAAASPPPAYSLVLDAGDVIVLGGSGVLLGRAPAAAADDLGVAMVPVADTTMSISKTHLAVLRRGREIVAVDRHSTNGSAIVRGGAEHRLVPGQPAIVHPGDTLTFGDRSATVRAD